MFVVVDFSKQIQFSDSPSIASFPVHSSLQELPGHFERTFGITFEKCPATDRAMLMV